MAKSIGRPPKAPGEKSKAVTIMLEPYYQAELERLREVLTASFKTPVTRSRVVVHALDALGDELRRG